MRYKRSDRRAELLLQGIVGILEKEINDPRVGFATLIRAEVSPDLKHAAIWVSVLGDEKKKRDSLIGLEHAAPYIQRRLGETLQLRFTPHLRFRLDEGLERSEKISLILNELKPAAPDPGGKIP